MAEDLELDQLGDEIDLIYRTKEASTPSFHLYPRTNNAWCYGCPPGFQGYDAVTFTRLKLDMNAVEALEWLENHYELPKIDDYTSPEDEDEDDGRDALNFHDLFGAFLRKGARRIQETGDPELAEDYAQALFEGWPAPQSDPNSPEELEKVVDMAQILGPEMLETIKRGKR
jgi:hypothetical protein